MGVNAPTLLLMRHLGKILIGLGIILLPNGTIEDFIIPMTPFTISAGLILIVTGAIIEWNKK